jgi:hypothetical protein
MRNPRGEWDYQPHWLWALLLIFVPLILITISVGGIAVGSAISYPVAETAPVLAVTISCIGMAASLLRRRKVLIAIAAIGLTISVGGFLMVLWVT